MHHTMDISECATELAKTHMHHTVVQNSSGLQVIWCCRTAALEQAACFTAVIWQSLPIQKTF